MFMNVVEIVVDEGKDHENDIPVTSNTTQGKF